jgi:hypothetical protein
MKLIQNIINVIIQFKYMYRYVLVHSCLNLTNFSKLFLVSTCDCMSTESEQGESVPDAEEDGRQNITSTPSTSSGLRPKRISKFLQIKYKA